MDQTVLTSDATRSREEVESAILAFTPAEFLRLERVSMYYGSLYNLEAGDLVQEAIARALGGTRKCPVDVTVVKFLAEAIRSIAHGESEKTENKVTPFSQFSNPDSPIDPVETTPSVEMKIIKEEEAANVRESIFSLFEDGTPERDMLEGIWEGLSAKDLRDLLSLDQTAYDSMRRKIRRRINKAFPEGWKYE